MQVASHLDQPLSPHVEKRFPDGESYLRSDVNVRGGDVYVIYSLYTDENQKAGEKIHDLLQFIGSLKDASAKKVTLVCPYLAYSRQDRKTESRAPIGTKYIAQQLESMGVNRLLTMDIHNLAAFQNAFRIPTDNLEVKNLFVDYLCGGYDRHGLKITDCVEDPLENTPSELTIVSPDVGGMGRVRRMRNALEKRLKGCSIKTAYVDKERAGDAVHGSEIVGDVEGRRCLILDDMIASGSTIQISMNAVENHGGDPWAVCATHGFFTGAATEKLEKVKKLIIADTIPPFRLPEDWQKNRLSVINTTKMTAQAIRRIHEGSGSISDLLK